MTDTSSTGTAAVPVECHFPAPRRRRRIRILHTADWHLGHELAGWPREREQRAVLAAIAAIVRAEAVDAVVIAGDVFDHQNPSAAMYRQLFDFFEPLAGLDVTVVAIAGNHDSVGRLEAPGGLLRRFKVHAVGALASHGGEIDLSRHLIEVRRRGETVGGILAIPYLRPADLPGFVGFETGEGDDLEAGVRQLYATALTAARARLGALPLVATGHLHVRGASLSDPLSERRILVGGEEGIGVEAFGELADYVALGHLHRAQTLPGKDRKVRPQVRYAGSPLPLSATERTYEHGVSLVEISADKLTVEHRPLPRPVPFLRLPETGRLSLDEAEAALAGLALDAAADQQDWPFVQVLLQVEGPQPGLRGRLDEIVARFPVRALAPDIAWPQMEAPAAVTEPLQRLSERRPEDLFATAFAAEHGSPPGPTHLALFSQLLEETGR